MELHTVQYIADAVEELETYLPLLERQQDINQTIVQHSVAALRATINTYKKQLYTD